MFTRIRRNAFPILFCSMFFLPYIPGTRIRYEIVIIFILVLFSLLKDKFNNDIILNRKIYGAATITLILTIFRSLFTNHVQLGQSIIDIINLNFLFFTIFAWASLRCKLAIHAYAILITFSILSIFINVIAIFQLLNPDHLFNNYIFKYYGGAIIAPYGVESTSAEFMVRIAKRCTSIFPTFQALALFNLLIITIVIYLYRKSKLNRNILLIVFLFAIAGGLTTSSKTFMLGLLIVLSSYLSYIVKNMKRAVIVIIVGITVLYFLGSNIDITKNLNYMEALFTFNYDDIYGSRYGTSNDAGYLSHTIKSLLNDIELLFAGTGSDYDYYGLKYADSQYIQPFVYGGIIYLLTYLYQLILFFKRLLIITSNNRFIKSLLLLHILIGIGMPVFMIGRYSAILIFILLVIANNELVKKYPSFNQI